MKRAIVSLLAAVAALLLALAPVLAMEIAEDRALGDHLRHHGMEGVAAVYDPATGIMRVSDAAEAAARRVPASTFKIPAALLALDLGIVGDPHRDVFRFDWEPFFVRACNQDQTLASALARSCVPVFARLGRAIGDERLRAGLAAYGYGNADASGTYPYWLSGNLRISATEQVMFMDRLRRGDLPASQDALRATTGIIEIDRQGDYVLRGKTGWAPSASPGVGWLVGWGERGGEVRVFALRLDVARGTDPALRRTIVDSILRAEGIAPR